MSRIHCLTLPDGRIALYLDLGKGYRNPYLGTVPNAIEASIVVARYARLTESASVTE